MVKSSNVSIIESILLIEQTFAMKPKKYFDGIRMFLINKWILGIHNTIIIKNLVTVIIYVKC